MRREKAQTDGIRANGIKRMRKTILGPYDPGKKMEKSTKRKK